MVKLKWCGYPMVKKKVFLLILTVHERDRHRTDGQTDGHCTTCRHRVAKTQTAHNAMDSQIYQYKCLYTSSVWNCYQTCEHDILKMNELILISIGTSDPWVRACNGQRGGSGGRRTRLHEVKDRHHYLPP